MPRTVPTVVSHIPSDLITAADYNNGPSATNTFLTAPPIFMGYNSATQSLVNGTITVLALNTELVDSDNGHSTVTNNSRYICQVAGWYAASGVACFAANATGSRKVSILRNGFAVDGATSQYAAALAGLTCVPTPTVLVQLQVNDYLEVWMTQNSGGSLSTSNATQTTCGMSVWWIAHV